LSPVFLLLSWKIAAEKALFVFESDGLLPTDFSGAGNFLGSDTRDPLSAGHRLTSNLSCSFRGDCPLRLGYALFLRRLTVFPYAFSSVPPNVFLLFAISGNFPS